MAECEVCILTPEDVVTMRDMVTMFGHAFEDPDHYHRGQPDDDYLRRWLADSHHIAISAVQEGAVIGGLAAYELHKFEQPRSEIYIYDLAVVESHRRRGIATALIDSLRAEAKRRGAWVIYVQADLGDEPAIALYTKHGQREDVLHFDILPQGRSGFDG